MELTEICFYHPVVGVCKQRWVHLCHTPLIRHHQQRWTLLTWAVESVKWTDKTLRTESVNDCIEDLKIHGGKPIKIPALKLFTFQKEAL